MTAHEIHALSGAYAVDALDDVERARFEAHLAACAECQAEVASLQDATAALALLTEVAPPAALREQLLADITKVRPLPPVVARIDARRPRRWTNLVAAAAVLGVLGGGAVVVQNILDDTSSTPPSNPGDQVLSAADVEHVTTDLGNGATATVSRSLTEDKAVLVTRNLPAAPKGSVYQLWLLKDGRMVSAGLMPRSGNQTVLLEGSADDATGAGITIEPKGGSENPTVPAVATFQFKKSTG
jgi:anti-sigma-K factor RskA